MGVALAAWYVLQPKEQRASVACRPVVQLSRWIVGDDRADNVWGQKVQELARSFAEKCPSTIGTPAAALADQARTAADRALKGVRSSMHRHIEEVPAADRLMIAGLGDARLIQRGLAHPWGIPGPWQGWATGPSPAGGPTARAAPGT